MKAVALLSGGLDSALAVRKILEQGIEVEALKFTSPFCLCDRSGRCHSREVAKEVNIPVKNHRKGGRLPRDSQKPEIRIRLWNEPLHRLQDLHAEKSERVR